MSRNKQVTVYSVLRENRINLIDKIGCGPVWGPAAMIYTIKRVYEHKTYDSTVGNCLMFDLDVPTKRIDGFWDNGISSRCQYITGGSFFQVKSHAPQITGVYDDGFQKFVYTRV